MTTPASLANAASTAPPPATARERGKSHRDDRPGTKATSAFASISLRTKSDKRSNKPFLIAAASSALLLCLRSPSTTTSDAFGVSPAAVSPVRRSLLSAATSNPPVLDAFGAFRRVGTFPERGTRASSLSGRLKNSYLDTLSVDDAPLSDDGERPTKSHSDAISEECANDGGVGGPTLSERVTLGASVPPVSPPGSTPAGFRLNDVLKACDAGEPTTECTSAIASYLADISSGASEPSTEGATAIASYLDGLTSKGPASGTAIASYLDALAAGAAERPTPGALASYFTALAKGTVSKPSSAASIVYNLLEHDLMTAPRASEAPEPSTAATTPEESAPESTETAASASSPSTGPYLDALSQECDGATASPKDCAPAMTSYLDALSSGAAARPSEAGGDAAAGVIASYLDAISSSGDVVVPPSSERTTPASSTGEAVASYLDSLSSGEAAPPSTAAVTSYLDALSSGEVRPPRAPESISSYVSGGTGDGVATSASSDAVEAEPEGVPEAARAPPPPSDAPWFVGKDRDLEIDIVRRVGVLTFMTAAALAAIAIISPVPEEKAAVVARGGDERFFKKFEDQKERAAEKQRKLERQLETVRRAQKKGAKELREMEERETKLEAEKRAAAKAEGEAKEKAVLEAERLAEKRKLSEAKAAREAERIADEQAAAKARRLAKEKAAAEAKMPAEEKAAAEAKKSFAATPEGDGQVPGNTFQKPSAAYDAHLQRLASES